METKGKISMAIGTVLVIVTVLMVLSIIPSPLSTVTYTINTPTGNFYINGELATPSSSHTVSSPTLQIKFVATAFGEEITRVRVVRRNVDAPYDPVGFELDETVTDQEWTGTHTLPAPGTYKLLGYIYAPAFDDEEGFIQVMSLVGDWTGDEGTFTSETVSWSPPSFNWLSMFLLIVGVALVGVGAYWEHES